jgi:hypothetical protein
MDAQVPQCPRCKEGGRVTLVSEEDEKGDFSPSPTRKRKSQLFQCTCGWTLVRTKPREGKSET